VLFSELFFLIDPQPHPGPVNMAVDEVLLRAARKPTLRIYRWREPSVSLGYFNRYAAAEEMAAGRALVRRWTGGGIVEHGEDLTYTLIVPREHAFFGHAAPESYRLIHEAIAQALAGEGITAQVAAVLDASHGGACFANPVQYDLMAGGAKIAGAAQRRTRWGLLHQGSILLPSPLLRLGGKLPFVFSGNVNSCDLAGETLDAAQALAETKYGTAAWMRKF
jgi:lipoate-protein ligase A